jgi:protein-tyrosine phosphatase
MPNTPGPLRLDLRGTGFNNGLNTGKHTSRVLANDADGPLDTGTSNATAVAGDRGRRTSAGSSDSPRAGAGEGDVLQPANPFFDNIRQNLELSHGGITERIALNLPPEIASRAHELPSFLRDLVEKPQNETATILANEFENVERDEQRRLQSIMEWHSRGLKRIDEAARVQRRKERSSRRMSIQGDAHGGEVPDRKSLRVQRTQSGMVHVKTFEPDEGSETPEDYFPFSITAGVERGAKNRCVVCRHPECR